MLTSRTASKGQPAPDTPLTTASEIRALKASEAQASPRTVRLRGVLLGVNSMHNQLTLHDGTGAAGVILARPQPELKQGDSVEVTGLTGQTQFGNSAEPRVITASARVTGTAPLPAPDVVDLNTLLSFKKFDQWVSIECFVMEWRHARGELVLHMATRNGQAHAVVAMPDAATIPPNFHGARLRLTGVNAGARSRDYALFVPSPTQMEVLEPGAAEIFKAPEASVSDLLGRKVEFGRRWRARGVVAATAKQQRYLMLVAPDGAMTVNLLVPRMIQEAGVIYGDTGSWPPPQPGDIVEIVGSTMEAPSAEVLSQGLTGCHLRIVGHQAPPGQRVVDIQTLLGWKNHDEWCSVEGLVTGWAQRGGDRLYALADPHGWAVIHVWDEAGSFPQDLFGARVRFTGISRSRLGNAGDALVVPHPSRVEFIKPGGSDPFAVPESSVKAILANSTPAAERVRTKGIVIGSVEPGTLHIRGADVAMCVLLQSPWVHLEYGEFKAKPEQQPDVEVGDEVEVVGSPIRPPAGPAFAGADLYQSQVRVLRKGEAPAPVACTLEAVASGAFTSDLVELRGRLVSKDQRPDGRQWRGTMLLESGGMRLPVVHQGNAIGVLETLRIDDEILVRGLVDRGHGDSPRQIRIVSAADIHTLGVSPAVLMRRVWIWGGGALGLVALLGGWVVVLRRANRIQARAAVEMKAASDAALDSERRWKLLFEQSPLSVQIFSPDGQTMRFNQAWRNLFRLSDEQGRAFNVLKDPDLNASGAVNLIRKAFEGEVVHVPPVPFPVNTDPPEHRWIGGVLYPVKNGAGEITEVVTIHNDITEMKRAEEAMLAINQTLEKRVQERTSELEKAQSGLQRALDQERELGELKSRFVSMVSHEFRTPLGIIMSAVELLQHYSDRLPDEEKQLQLHEIQTSTKRMGGLMEQVLLLGRAEAGKLTCKPQPLDLAGVAERIIDETHSVTDRKCPVMLETAGDLSRALVDEALLRHILGNLVTNAVKYSPAGSEVHVRIRRDGVDAVFEVIDRGIGIPEKDRARLFEAFHRCSNVGDTPGTGLGLVIVKRCVDLHGGSIHIDSLTGAGTTFTVHLPLFP